MTFPLLSLPDVVLRQLLSGGYLDPESTIFIGVTCQHLNKIVSKQIESRGSEHWQSLLDGIDTFTKDLVQVNSYSALRLVQPNTEELISQLLFGLQFWRPLKRQ